MNAGSSGLCSTLLARARARVTAQLPAVASVNPGESIALSWRDASFHLVGSGKATTFQRRIPTSDVLEETREHFRDLDHPVRLLEHAIGARGQRAGLESGAAVSARDEDRQGGIDLA